MTRPQGHAFPLFTEGVIKCHLYQNENCLKDGETGDAVILRYAART